MIYSNRDILQALTLDEDDNKRLVIEPFIQSNLQPASYDITLDTSFCVPRKAKSPVDIKKQSIKYHRANYEEFTLYPNSFVLATTKEYISLPANITAQVQGRSSIGRLGIFIHTASGWIDPGFSGQITLELYNASKSPILLEAGMRIGQLIFAECNTSADKLYEGKYKDQKGATESRIFMDYIKEE